MSDDGMSNARISRRIEMLRLYYGNGKPDMHQPSLVDGAGNWTPADMLPALLARLDAAERERDALREALLSDDAITAAVLAHWGEPPINKVSAHLRSNQMRHAIRAALTANHSAPVVEE